MSFCAGSGARILMSYTLDHRPDHPLPGGAVRRARILMQGGRFRVTRAVPDVAGRCRPCSRMRPGWRAWADRYWRGLVVRGGMVARARAVRTARPSVAM